jgi:thioredoxin 1
MDDELELIKKKKLEELKNRYIDGGKKMEDLPNTPIELTDTNINSQVSKYDTIVVDCWAPWCGPCRMIAPVIEELAKELHGKVVFGKLNVDNNQGTAMKYGIMSIPSLLVFKNGNLVDKIIGALPKQMLMTKLQPYV